MKSFENPAPHSTLEQTPVPEISPIDTEISLRTQEHQGMLSLEDFQFLIDQDFEEIVREIPPLKEEFDPSIEAQKIFKSESKDYHKAYDEFRDKFVRQRKAMGQCRCFIERMIAFDNDVSKEYLLDILARFATQYGFSEKQFEQFEYMINLYYNIRAKMLEKRAVFTNDRELVKDLTGIEPDSHADIRVETGPISIDIYADGITSSAIHSKNAKAAENFTLRGFSSMKSVDDQILFNVINIDPIILRTQRDPNGVDARIHEQEHQKNRLLNVLFSGSVKSTFENHIKNYKTITDPELKREILETAFTDELENACDRARDEIIARLSMQSAQHVLETYQSVFFAGKIKVYDYLSKQREQHDLKDDSLYQEVANEFLVERYKEKVKRGIEAITTLVRVGGYTNTEAVALLTDKTLHEWPKTVRRIITQDAIGSTSQNAL